MLSEPTVPSFLWMTAILAASLSLLTLGFVTILIHRSWKSFAESFLPARNPMPAVPPPESEMSDHTCSGSSEAKESAAQGDAQISVIDILSRGIIPNKTFFALLALQFSVAIGFVLWLNDFEYLPADAKPGHQGIGAFLGDEKDPVEIAMARILACDWSDRFKASEINEIAEALAQPAPPATAAALPGPPAVDTARLEAFLEFAAAVEKEFISEAPSAIQRLVAQLQPVYVILGALFVIILRRLVRQTDGFRMQSTIEGALLAFCLVFLAYYVILSYHAGTEVARAIAAGRIVCTDYVKPFFASQAQCLSLSAIILVSLFVISPQPILRNI